jgi:formylglycine-generating enzyme required for sulfatase activity
LILRFVDLRDGLVGLYATYAGQVAIYQASSTLKSEPRGAPPGTVTISGISRGLIGGTAHCHSSTDTRRDAANKPATSRNRQGVYRVLPDPAVLNEARKKRWPVAMVAALIVCVIAILGGGYFLLLQKHIANQAPTPADTQQTNRSPVVTANTPNTVPAPARVPAEAAPIESRSRKPAVAPITPQLIPEMVSVPGGTFAMGSDDDLSEKPIHRVTIRPFAISKFPITIREWNACVAAKSCTYVPTGKDDAPVANISWTDAQEFVDWLSKVTKKTFRLPSEAEWEYAARGRTSTKFWWGDQLQADTANCKGCNEPYDTSQPLKVGSFKPNPFGLYDMGGNIHQWVMDCWHKNYQGAPLDGSPWAENNCLSHVIRSGSWKNGPSYVRPSNRDHYDTGVRYPTHGFRVAHSL